MPRVLKYFILFAFSSTMVSAQSVSDSLENALKQSQNQQEQANLLNELSLFLINSDPEKSLQKGQEAYQLASKINNTYELALSYVRMGNYYDVKSNYDTALYLYDLAMDIGKKHNYQLVIAQALIRTGVTNRYIGNYDEALEYLKRGLVMTEEMNNAFWESYAQNIIGLVYQQQGDFDQSLVHALKALSIRQKLGYKLDIASSLGNVGLVYDYKGEFDKALDYYFKSLEMNTEIGSLNGAAINWNNIGIVYGMQGNLDKSLDAYQHAFELHKQVGNKRYMAGTLDNIGQNLYDRGKFVQALEVYHQTLNIREEIGDKDGMGTSLLNIGDMLRLQNRYEDALPQYLQAYVIWKETGNKYGQADALHNLGKLFRELHQKDSAKRYFERALVLRKSTGARDGIATCLNSIASLQREDRNYSQAALNYEQALTIAEEIGNPAIAITSLKGLAYTKYDQNQLIEALEYAEEANNKLKNTNQIIYLKDVHLILSKIHSKLGNYQLALDHHVHFVELQDSLLNQATAEQLTQMQVQFDTEQKESLISDQQHEITLLAAINSYRQKLLWIGGSSLLLLFGLILVYRSRRYAVKEKDIHRHYSQMLLTSHEEERKRISRDLHDSVGQSLMLIKNKVLLDSGGETADMVGKALEEVRSISKALHPALLEEIGLTASIAKLISEFDETTDIFFTSEIDPIDGIFSKDQELHIFRIIQESINNLIKHSESPSANIQVKNEHQKMVVHIRDFGVGFDLTSTSFTNSLGMKTLKERTQILNGKIAIHSEKSKGTSILLELPK